MMFSGWVSTTKISQFHKQSTNQLTRVDFTSSREKSPMSNGRGTLGVEAEENLDYNIRNL